MRKVILFMMVTLDGYFEGPDHDLGWHNVNREFNAFAVENMNDADTLLFGRRTYELMAGFWPHYEVRDGDRDNASVAEKMNNLPKIVFSRTLMTVEQSAKWKNVTLVRSNLTEEITNLKQQPGKDLMILGSSNLCVSLLESGLLDELRIMINPVVIGAGTPLFSGIKKEFTFKLLKTRTFESGNILLYYQPSAG
jgi:dihydrofolate reductase